MKTLLILAVVVIALAIIVQAGVLTAMYLMSRRIGMKVEGLIAETQKVTAPLETASGNLKSLSEDLSQAGKAAREQIQHIQKLVMETRETVFVNATDVKDHVIQSFDEAWTIVLRPIREWSAIAQGIAAGLRTLFSRKPRIEEAERREPEAPAA